MERPSPTDNGPVVEDNSTFPRAGDRPEGFSPDYHDYVFRDGRLVGDFDNMYRYSAEVPWHQDERCDHWCSLVGMLMLRDHAPFGGILEIGCGLGYISAKLREMAVEGVDAFDISPEAVRKAAARHENICFYVDDITCPTFQPKAEYDLVVVRDVFWYVVPWLRTVVDNITRCVRPGGHLYVCQAFPALDKPFVGKETLPDPDALLGFFPQFPPVHSARIMNHTLENDGPTLHFLGVKAT